MISKAEFDSQRGVDELDQEGDGDLVFGPLDQEEASVMATPPPPAQSLAGDAPKPDQRPPEQDQRGRGKEREGRKKASSTGSLTQPRRSRDRSERFYPVPNKQQQKSASHVSVFAF